MVICLERSADLHMVQRMPLPLTVSCFSKIQIGFTCLVPAHPGSPGQSAVKRVCVGLWKCSCWDIRLDNQPDFLSAVLGWSAVAGWGLQCLFFNIESVVIALVITSTHDGSSDRKCIRSMDSSASYPHRLCSGISGGSGSLLAQRWHVILLL